MFFLRGERGDVGTLLSRAALAVLTPGGGLGESVGTITDDVSGTRLSEVRSSTWNLRRDLCLRPPPTDLDIREGLRRWCCRDAVLGRDWKPPPKRCIERGVCAVLGRRCEILPDPLRSAKCATLRCCEGNCRRVDVLPLARTLSPLRIRECKGW